MAQQNTAPTKNAATSPVRSAPEPEVETPTEQAEIRFRDPEPTRIARDEVTNAVAGAYISLGHDAGDISDLVTVATVDAVMGLLQRRNVADTDESAPKLGSFRALTGRKPSR